MILNRIKYRLKTFFPRGLFARFFLIIILPLIIVQLVSISIFYKTHLQNVVKRISSDTVQKIIFVNNNFKTDTNFTDINYEVKFLKRKKISRKDIISNKIKSIFFNQEDFFMDTLSDKIKDPINLKTQGKFYIINIQKSNGILSIKINKRDVIIKTARIFVLWNIGLTFVLLIIALIFMKNQLKPIKNLKRYVKNFSINQNKHYFKPTGAKDIRELGLSFIDMEKRIKKFINQRTIMLAGISHDLRTPLTRMKLELEMMDNPSKSYLKEDIDYMEKIINQYLNFTKDTKNENRSLTNIYDFVRKILKDYKKINENVYLKNKNLNENEIVLLQQISFKRVIHNVLDNAFKFGTKAIITLSKSDNGKRIIINIEDNGCGVDEKVLNKLSEPFFKVDKSRNIENKGVGLGLAIAKDILLSNNATINFSKSTKYGGLDVKITLNTFYK